MNDVKLLIKTDEANRILDVFRSGYLTDTTGLHEIDYGEKFYAFSCGHFIDKHEIHDINACHNYIYENGVIRLATDEEKTVELASFAEPEPTSEELQWQAITDLEIAQMETEQALTDLEIAQLEG